MTDEKDTKDVAAEAAAEETKEETATPAEEAKEEVKEEAAPVAEENLPAVEAEKEAAGQVGFAPAMRKQDVSLRC